MPPTLDTFDTPMPVSESILRALSLTTPQLPQVHLPDTELNEPTLEYPHELPVHRYKMGGEIARGGMGAVLRGRDEDLGRDIALKVMLQHHAGKTELLQRFVEEAQIAGQLQHPGITPVYELGRFSDQRPYFTMKLVRGETLSHLLKDRRDAGSERSRFLKIFEQICQTLAYAHARKVIHRDLKPQNVMVGSFGEVQVMDWGLAKILVGEQSAPPTPTVAPTVTNEGSVQTKRSSGQSTDIPNTQAGSVLGTPAYMAPEQAQGLIDQLDERADVFGLGAILCEILTGKPPYIGATGMEIYRQAVNADLQDAMHRLAHSGADEELIILATRCLSADREARPRDAGILTRELTAYLHSVDERLKQAELRAVEAKTKAGEETKRRRITIRLAAGILLALLAGLGASLWQMKRAMLAEAQALENEATAKRRLTQVENGVTLFSELVNGIDPRAEVKGGLPLYQQLLARAAKAADQLQPDLIASPIAVARMQMVLANTLKNLGNGAKAESILSKAIPAIESKAGPNNPDLLLATYYLADSYRIQGKIREALDLYLSLKDKNLQQEGPSKDLKSTVLNDLAIMYKETGNYRSAVALFEQLCDPRGDPMKMDDRDLSSYGNLASTYFALGRVQEALIMNEKAVSAFAEKHGEEHFDTLTAKTNLSGMYSAVGRDVKALALLNEVIEVQKKKFGKNHFNTLIAINNLAGALLGTGQVAEGVRMFEELCSTYEANYSNDLPEFLKAQSNLGTAYYDARQWSKAVAQLKKAVELETAKLGENHPQTLHTRSSLARALRANGQLKQSIEMFEQVREKQVSILGENHSDTMRTVNNLAEAYRNAGQREKTVELLEKIVTGQVNNMGPDHPDTLIVQGNLSSAYHRIGKMQEAVALIEKTTTSLERIQFQHRFATNILQDAVEINEAARHYTDAEQWKRKLLLLIEQRHGKASPQYANELSGLARTLMLQGKAKEAEPFLRDCLAIREKTQPDAWTTFNVHSMLGGALLSQKNYPAAEPLLLKGYEGMKAREKSVPPSGKPRIGEALDRLIQLYTETIKPNELKKWQEEKKRWDQEARSSG